MILTVLLLTLVSSSLAQPADENAQQRSPRAPQGQIRYSDPDGSKVDWKLYTPQNRGQTEALIARRTQRAETGTGQASFAPQKQQVVQAPIEHQPQYQPYSAVPSHIKQLIVQAYSPQGPYVDPGAFFYQAPAISPISAAAVQQKQDQSFSQVSPEHSYFNSAVNYRAAGYEQTAEASASGPGKVGGIKYADEARVYQRSAEPAYGSVLPRQTPTKRQYQPYKQIQTSQQPTPQPQPQYQQHSQQFLSPQYQPQHQPQHQHQHQLQYQQSNKQVSQPQYQPQYQQLGKQIFQSQLQYPQLNRQTQQSQQHFDKQIPQPQLITPASPTQYGKNMPTAIQTLLNYQAQLPYNVIANHILYRPKQLFIPKPLPQDAKYVGQYPSKVYFVKVDGDVYDGGLTTKDVKSEKPY